MEILQEYLDQLVFACSYLVVVELTPQNKHPIPEWTLCWHLKLEYLLDLLCEEVLPHFKQPDIRPKSKELQPRYKLFKV